MNKFASLLMLFMLFASLGFAWIDTPTCATQYSVVGVNFTYASMNASLCAGTTTAQAQGVQIFGQTNWVHGGSGETCGPTTPYDIHLNSTHRQIKLRVNDADSGYCEAVTKSITATIALPSSGNYTLTTSCGGNANDFVKFGTTKIIGTVNITELNASTFNITNGTAHTTSTRGGNLSITMSAFSPRTGEGVSILTFPVWTPSAPFELAVSSDLTFANTGDYISVNLANNKVTHSDFTTGIRTIASTSTYCRSLLYFNNPYYGNIQLIPMITYVPGVDAFANFINTSDNSAYIPNNTITYVYDSVTSIWYIVPATTCTSFSIVGSTTTLQYNPTATGTAPGGTVPIDVTGITGSCSYATATRLISCTGTDTSNTVTSLTLSAYLTGNTTDLCGSSVGGASGTLTCTLPAQNGTYNALFYGSDANLFLHSFASKTITIGSGSTGYGRDAYIAVMLLVGVAALLLSSNIAVSMVLTCFGLFVALAVGALPISDAPVVVFFTVIALVLAYRLKV